MKINKDFLKWINTRPDGQAYLFTTDNEFEYGDYLDFCEANGLSPLPEDSPEFSQWCDEEALAYYDEDITACKDSANLNRRFVITGSVGRWNGRFNIVPVFCRDFEEVIRRTTGGDILAVTATYDTRCIHFECSHHDSTNSYDIWLVKHGADEGAIMQRIDNRAFNPSCGYDRRFVEHITDFLL